MQKIRKVKIKSRNYPSSLKNIKKPPKVLYVRGKIPRDSCFGIVGTRRCSNYGKRVALEIAADLAEAGLVIVSGMARGIDAYAHRGCLETGGKTIAVLGTGIDEKSIYPQENLKLSRQIIQKGGCLISEFSPGTPGRKFRFPARNRLISGLSLGVLVVEAKIKSGALITAQWAEQQNKKLFAVPGPIHAANSKGTHFLLKKGAVLVENANDILKELNISHTIQKNKKKMVSKTSEESLILKALKEKSLHIEKIVETTGLPVQKILSMLATMEIRGEIRNLGGNTFALRRKSQ